MYSQTNAASGEIACGHGFRNHFRSNHPLAHFAIGFRRPKYNVPMNITESDTNYLVYVFANGFDKEHIQLSVVDDILSIKGNKELAETISFSHQEFPVKNFERSLALNGQIDTENITAKSEDGILKLTLPKLPKAQRKEQKIEVQ